MSPSLLYCSLTALYKINVLLLLLLLLISYYYSQGNLTGRINEQIKDKASLVKEETAVYISSRTLSLFKWQSCFEYKIKTGLWVLDPLLCIMVERRRRTRFSIQPHHRQHFPTFPVRYYSKWQINKTFDSLWKFELSIGYNLNR